VVNTRSMAGPTGELIAPFEGAPRKGQWNFMGILEGWDHSEIIGIGPEHGDEVLPFYRRWAAFLSTLEE
jgi:triacylglycerol lipase